MSFNRPTLTQIYQRLKADMEKKVTDDLPFPKVLIDVFNAVFAGGIHLSYGFLEWIYKQLLPDTADTIGLERYGAIYNVPRKPDTFTTGTVLFTGVPSYVIAQGTRFFNSDGLEYSTDTALTIDTFGSISGTATALEPGEAYNTEDATFTLTNPDANIISIANQSGFDDGQDQETEADWLLRILQRIQNPPSSGTTADFERWALSVDGVGKAWAFGAEEWLGSGTVGVGVSDSQLFPVSAGVLQDVEEYVDSVRPEQAGVDYFTIVDKPIDIYISITPNTSEIRAAISASLEELFLAESSPGGTMLLTHIQSAIAASFVNDYEITRIDNDSVTIPVGDIVQGGIDTSRFNNAVYTTLT